MNDVIEQLTQPNPEVATEQTPTETTAVETTAADTTATAETTEQTTTETKFDLNSMSEHYAKEGSLTDEHYATLEANGIPRQVVDDYIATQQKLAELTAQMEGQSAEKAVMDTLSAAEVTLDEFNTMAAWANQNLSDAQKTRYEKLVSSSDPDIKAAGVTMLKNLFLNATGQPAQQTVEAKPTNTNTAGYASRAAAIADISKPEYESDPDFRSAVDAKLNASSFEI